MKTYFNENDFPPRYWLKRRVNLLWNILAHRLGSLNVAPYPSHLMIEPSSFCNLRCVSCHVGQGDIKKKPGLMSLENFKKIIDETEQYLCSITLYNAGEPFTNPEFLAMVKYASSKGVWVGTSTNGHFLDGPDDGLAVVQSGLGNINISLDGLSQETLEQYRRGGDYEKVIRGIKNIVSAKKRLNSRTPHVFLQFIPMRHNEHEIPKLESFAKELGVDYLKIKKYNGHKDQSDWAGREDWKVFSPVNDEWSRYVSYKKTKGCLSFWQGMNINYDGNVVPCCYDHFEEVLLGNVFKEGGVKAVWQGTKSREFRRGVFELKNSIRICRERCFLRQNIAKTIKLKY